MMPYALDEGGMGCGDAGVVYLLIEQWFVRNIYSYTFIRQKVWVELSYGLCATRNTVGLCRLYYSGGIDDNRDSSENRTRSNG